MHDEVGAADLLLEAADHVVRDLGGAEVGAGAHGDDVAAAVDLVTGGAEAAAEVITGRGGGVSLFGAFVTMAISDDGGISSSAFRIVLVKCFRGEGSER